MMRWTYDHIGEDYIFHCRLETKTHSFEACVLQGGNDLWSAWINCVLLGRRKKRGIGRIAGKSVELRMMRPQAQTRKEAIAWAEENWKQMQTMTL